MTVIQELELTKASLAESIKDREALMRSATEMKAAKDKLVQELAAAQAEVAKAVEAEAVAVTIGKLWVKELDEAKAKIAAAEAKMALVPVGDVSAGQKPVADGSVSGDGEKDIIKEMESIQDSEKRIAFYNAHRVEIDAAWAKRNG